MESQFYNLCRKKGLLPQPLLNCVKHNEFRYQGKILSPGYAAVLGELFLHNTELERHILKLNIDDCSMKDEDFSAILEGIFHSKYGCALQSITYSNNALGAKSVASICKFVM